MNLFEYLMKAQELFHNKRMHNPILSEESQTKVSIYISYYYYEVGLF